MMRAQYREADGKIVLHVCGRLAENWVKELEDYWRAGPKNISVDLRGVTFIDDSGGRLLRRMHRGGATFVAGGLLVQEIVKQITGGSK